MTDQEHVDPLLSRAHVYDLRGLPRVGDPLPSVDYGAQIERAVTEGDLTGLEFTGVTPGSVEERYLKYYAYSYSVVERWGGEYRSVLAVGPATGGTGPPLGQFILRWSAGGRCTASLIALGAVTVGDNGTVEKLGAVLKDKFGFTEVIARGKEWTVPELRAVSKALLRMPDPDRAALAGVKLVRMPSVEGAEPNMDARFFRDQRFQNNQATDIVELQVGDGAFEEDDRVFVGTPPACLPVSCQKIAHEAGHAVELAAVRRATSKQITASLELSQAGAALQTAGNAATMDQNSKYTQAQTRYQEAKARLTAAKGSNRSVPLDTFVDYMTERRINRRLTDYAGDTWATGPQELYADAYSLWLLDPQALTAFSPELTGFFDTGAYRPSPDG